MNTTAAATTYPESDGNPMADNTRQFEWLVTIKGGLDAVFRDDPTVFVAGDLLWYPVEGQNTIRQAPDVMVVFGRPKGYRGSYRQWEEGGVPPQVVFEILSPGNRSGEMQAKREFYELHGVEEYYLFDPDDDELAGWLRYEDELQEIPSLADWTSPLLGIRFENRENGMRIIGPDGVAFATYVELVRACVAEKQETVKERREKVKERREKVKERREKEKERSEKEKERSEKELALKQVELLTAKLRALGIDPDR